MLDDSTDETCAIARACVERHRHAGLDIVYIHRDNRQGFKAGALEHGLKLAKGEFVAVFDADFVPGRRLPQAHGAVLRRRQGRHGAGALGPPEPRVLGPHPGAEHLPRRPLHHRAHRAQPLAAASSTSTAPPASGGATPSTTPAAGSTTRSPKTSTSRYRAQLKGWQFVFLPEVISPAEVPVDMNAFKSQQHRWAKGSHPDREEAAARASSRATCRWEVKREAFFHLTNNLRLPADGAAVAADAAVDGGALQARPVRHAASRPAVLHHRHRLGVLLLRGHPARAGAAPGGSGSSTCRS